MLPSASVARTTTSSPAITALAAFVPCALAGIRQMVRCLVTVGAMEGPDGEEAGELALASGVGLDAHGVVAGHLGEPRLQLGDELAQPGRAVIRRERVEVGELGPRDRLHLRRGVELHRARPKWDHRAVEGQVLVGEASQVPEHLVLGVISLEHGLVQVVVGRAAVSRPSGASSGWSGRCAPNAASARSTTSEARRLVEGEADAAVVDATEIETVGRGRRRAPRRRRRPSTVTVSNHVSWRSRCPSACNPAAAIEA